MIMEGSMFFVIISTTFKQNKDNQQILSVIQEAFLNMNYPLTDLEQGLKHLSTQEASDMADELEKGL